MNGEVKHMEVLDFLNRKLKNVMIEEFLRESSMLVRKFYYIGLVSDFLEENYSRDVKVPGESRPFYALFRSGYF